MSGSFSDTNVLLYLISDDASKAAVAEDLLRQRPTISVQVLNEFVSVARRKSLRTWPEILDMLEIIKQGSSEVRPLTVNTHQLGLGLVARHGLHIYDAMIVAAALEAGCETLWSEDMQDGLRVGSRLSIVNPFR